jgi:glycosyltransferase involved in cell wall biosynthesis
MNKICIDARLWGTRHTGIGVYIENLIANLPKDEETKIILIVDKIAYDDPKLMGFEKVLAKHHPYSNLAQLEMAWILWKIKPDLLHVPHFTIPVLWSGKIVVTIHDLIKHFSKGADTTTRNQAVYWLKYFQYLIIMWITVHRAERIIVPTKYWQDMLVTTYGLAKHKIEVTYEGVSKNFLGKGDNIDLPDNAPYVLYVGNVYPHKNIPTLLSAIEKLNGKVLLILVGARSVFAQRIERMIKQRSMEKLVQVWGAVTEGELITLYKNATAFVLPSLIEGFGLTGLEAMATGTPVIAANASCLPEVYGSAAIYFEPTDSQQLADKISDLLLDDKLRQEMIKRGRKQVNKYSWVKMAKQTWQIYHDVLH